MGTETKYSVYAENTSTDAIPKVIEKGSSSDLIENVNNDAINGDPIAVNGKNCSSTINSYPNSTSSVPFVPVYIDENDVIEGAKNILRVIRPNWDLNRVEFKKFTDGITNKLVGCFNTAGKITNGSCSNGNSKNHNGSGHANGDDYENLSDTDTETETTTINLPAESTNNVVLVRVYGNKTDLLIDRKAETRNIILLHTHGFAPSLFATFKNGLAYDYVPGITLNTNSVLQPEIWKLVARRMAEMHRVVNATTGGSKATSKTTIPMLWKKTQSFFDLVPERFSDADKHKRLEGTFLPISRMREEFNTLYKRLENLGSPLVFAHNDLLLGNVIYTESRQIVNFIDYEYADYNFQAFDIGNHFAEFAGVDEVDYSRYPKREFQLKWLRVYLQAYLQKTQISDNEVERLYVQVNQFALASHIFWTIWCLIQAEHSTISFDYVSYAFLRYNEYLARKDEFLAMGLNGSS